MSCLYYVSASVDTNSIGEQHENGAIQAFFVTTTGPIDSPAAIQEVQSKLPIDDPFGWGSRHPVKLVAFSPMSVSEATGAFAVTDVVSAEKR